MVSIGSIFSSNKSKYNWDPEIYTSGFLNISGRTGCLGNLGKATSFYDAEGDADVTGTAAKGPYGEWGVVMPLRSGHSSVSQFAKIIQFSVFIYESLITILQINIYFSF